MGVAVGDQCVTLFGRARQDGVYTIEPEGSGGPALDVYCDMTRDGGGWTRVFYHDVAVGYWGGDADAIERNVANPLAPRYSILSYLESFRSDDGAFDFRLSGQRPTSLGAIFGARHRIQPARPSLATSPSKWPIQTIFGVVLNTTDSITRRSSMARWATKIGTTLWVLQQATEMAFPTITVLHQGWRSGSDRRSRRLEKRLRVAGVSFADASGDCDDADASIAPGAVERCDGIDNDCDGIVDNDCPVGDVTLEQRLRTCTSFPGI